MRALPRSKVPRVMVLDNALIYLYFLPPYSPDLNQIEPVFRQVKYQEIPQRSYTTRPGLRVAVEVGFSNFGC